MYFFVNGNFIEQYNDQTKSSETIYQPKNVKKGNNKEKRQKTKIQNTA